MSTSKKKLKVLYVIQTIFPEKAGAGINLHYFLKHTRDKYESRVMAVESNINNIESDHSNGYVRLKKKTNLRQIATFLQFLNVFTYVKNVFWCDVVHFKSIPKGVFFISIIAKLLRKKIVQEPTLVGHDDPDSFKKYKTEKLLTYSWRLSDAAVFISQDVKSNSTGFNGTLIPRGVNLEKFSYLKSKHMKKNLSEKNNTIVFSQVGKISDRKNQIKTLHIVKLLSDLLNINAEIIFIGPKGDDDYMQALTEEIKSAGIDVSFTGHVDNVEDYLSISDIYLFPSKDEGFGVSVIQALASGNLTFMSPVGCYQELEHIGFKGVINGDTSEWVNIIADNISKTTLNDREINSSLVKGFSEEAVAKKVLSFYNSIR